MDAITCTTDLLNDVCYMTDSYLHRQVYLDGTWFLIWAVIRLIIAVFLIYLFFGAIKQSNNNENSKNDREGYGFSAFIMVLGIIACTTWGFNGLREASVRFITPEPFMAEIVRAEVHESTR